MADAATKIHATRLLARDAASKANGGDDVRTVDVRVFATEMASAVVDNAMQSFGALGVATEMPFGVMSQRLRLARIRAADEVHRIVIARRAMRDYQTQP